MEAADFYEEYEEQLINNYPYADINQIRNIIEIVVNDDSILIQERLDAMKCLLQSFYEDVVPIYDEAIGGGGYTSEHLFNLETIFPDADLHYLKQFCKKHKGYDLDSLVDVLINGTYKKTIYVQYV